MNCDVIVLAKALAGELARSSNQSNEAKTAIIDAWELRISTNCGDEIFAEVLTLKYLMGEGYKMGVKDGKKAAGATQLWEKIVFVLFCAVMLGVGAITVLRNEPIRDPNLVVILRIFMMLVAGMFGSAMPGLLHLEGQLSGWTIRATAGFALAVLAYLFNPTVLPMPDAKHNPAPAANVVAPELHK